LMSQLRTLFGQITSRKREHQESGIPPEVTALAEAEYQGNVDALIRWAGGVGFDQCVAHLTGKEGVTDPEKLCGWLKAQSGVHQKSTKEADMPDKKTLKAYQSKFQEPEAPPEGGEVMTGLMAIAQALGLSEDATIEDILAAIETIKQAPAGEASEAQFQKVTAELQKRDERIASLEHTNRVHGYLEQTRLFTAIPGKTSEEIAVEIADIEEHQGKDKADSMLNTYTELNRMGVAATKAVGSSRPGAKATDYESKLAEYMKEHPDLNRADAHKALMKAHPELRSEYRAENQK